MAAMVALQPPRGAVFDLEDTFKQRAAEIAALVAERQKPAQPRPVAPVPVAPSAPVQAQEPVKAPSPFRPTPPAPVEDAPAKPPSPFAPRRG